MYASDFFITINCLILSNYISSRIFYIDICLLFYFILFIFVLQKMDSNTLVQRQELARKNDVYLIEHISNIEFFNEPDL